MARVAMISNKSFTYGTRRLRAGDDFLAKRQDARILEAVRMARKAPPAPAKPVRSVVEPELAILRAQYTDAAGKRPFMGWGENALREKIAALAPDEDTAMPISTDIDEPAQDSDGE